MALANSLVAYPLYFESQPTVRLIYSSTEETVTLGTTTARETWMVDDDHPDGTDVEGIGRGSLIRLLQAALDSHGSAGAGTFTVTLNADFTVTISAGANFQILWTSGGTTLDGNVFGYTTDTASGTSAAGTNQVQGIWLPGAPAWEDTRDQKRPMGRTSRSFTGLSRTSYFGAAKPERSITWDLLDKAITLAEYTAGVSSETFDYIWENAIGQGKPIRYYEDSTDISDGEYTLYSVRDASARPLSRSSAHNIRWRCQLDLDLMTQKQNYGSFSAQHFSRAGAGASLTPDADIFAIEGCTKATLSFWVRLDSDPTTNPIAVFGLSSLTSYLKGIYITTDPYVRFEWNDGGSGVVITGTTDLGAVWRHVVCVYDGSLATANVLKIYVDSVDEAATTPGTPPTSTSYDKFSSLALLNSGQAGIDAFTNGDVAHLAIWKEMAATQDQIDEMYDGGLAIDLNALTLTAKPTHWWKMNGDLTDSNSGNNLTDGGSSTFTTGHPGGY